MKRTGWVYAATNQALSGWVKVGFTRKDPGTRAKSLSSSGVPGRWEIRHACYSADALEAEKQIHLALRKTGVLTDRELFSAKVLDVVACINRVIAAIDLKNPLESSDFPDVEDFADFT